MAQANTHRLIRQARKEFPGIRPSDESYVASAT